MANLVPVTISIEQLEPEMVTASEIRDRSGRLLAGPGMTITGKHIKIFKTWGVVTIDIMIDDTLLAEKGLKSKEEDKLFEVDDNFARNYVENLFSLSEYQSSNAMSYLFDLIVKRVVSGKQTMR